MGIHTLQREKGRLARHARIRKHLAGMPERPRLAVFRSHNHMYVQLIDDLAGKTLKGWSTLDDRLAKQAHGGNVPAAAALGELVAKDAKAQGIHKVVFDRGGYKYHGRVKALAEALRAGGIDV